MSQFESRDNIEEENRQYKYIELLKDIVGRIKKESGRDITAHVETFGCQMNARDSEKLLGVLLACGFTSIDEEDADITVYNTCSVRVILLWILFLVLIISINSLNFYTTCIQANPMMNYS